MANDLIWRKKEIAVLKTLVSSAPEDRRNVLVRSLIAMLYAHWEGFVQKACGVYLEYLRKRRLRYCDLTSNFVALALHAQIRKASLRRNRAELIAVVDILRGPLHERSRIPTDVDTTSNLSSRVLQDLTITMGLDYKPFESKAVLIDERLLGNRNRIAHGEYLLIDQADVVELATEVVAMIDNFRDQVENAVVGATYRQ